MNQDVDSMFMCCFCGGLPLVAGVLLCRLSVFTRVAAVYFFSMFFDRGMWRIFTVKEKSTY